MGVSKYKNFYINLLRAVLCVAVLLYHLNVLKGGFLAVCTYFVLSSYLATSTQINKGGLKLKNYYLGRLRRVYLPLVIVVFLTIAVVSLSSDIVWVSLKPETTSVLLGYNNFWQIQANLDYFARHTDSPFMHLWYIAILIQFEILFPLLYLLLKKAEEAKRNAAIWIISLLSLIGTAYFIYLSETASITVVYYNSFARVFSLLFGSSAYFIFKKTGLFHVNSTADIKRNKIVFWVLLVLLCIMFVSIDAASTLFVPAMIAVSVISCFIVDAASRINDVQDAPLKLVTGYFSSLGYEIYLIQYPVIYLYQCFSGRSERSVSDIIIIILITLILSAVIHYGITDITTAFTTKKKFLKQTLCILLACVSVFGCFKFAVAQDHTEEMKLLEEQLAEESAEMEKLQAEYAAKMQESSNQWSDMLAQLENDENSLDEIVSNMNITFIGDSVMLGAAKKLHAAFQNSYCDSKVSRTSYAVGAILTDLENQGILGDPVVFHLGTNGTAPTSVNIAMVEQCGDREVFMINASNDSVTHVDKLIDRIMENHSNVHKIDWLGTSQGHSEYFVSDGVHLTGAGQDAYVQMVHQALYDFYSDKFNREKAEIIARHEEEMENRIAFFGNELLLGLFNKLDSKNASSGFYTDEDPDFSKLKEQILSTSVDGKLPPKLVFVYDSSFKLSKNELTELLKLTNGSQLYIFKIGNKALGQGISETDSICIIDFAAEIKEHPEYLLSDKKHLSEEGNQKAALLISEAIY